MQNYILISLSYSDASGKDLTIKICYQYPLILAESFITHCDRVVCRG